MVLRVRQPAMMIMFLLGIDPTMKSAWRVLKMLVGSAPASGMNFTDIVANFGEIPGLPELPRPLESIIDL